MNVTVFKKIRDKKINLTLIGKCLKIFFLISFLIIKKETLKISLKNNYYMKR